MESQRYRRGGKGAGVYLSGDNGSDGVRQMFDETKLFSREEIVYLVVEVMVAESSANVVRKAGRKRAGKGGLDRESDLLGIGALIREEAKTGVEDYLREVEGSTFNLHNGTGWRCGGPCQKRITDSAQHTLLHHFLTIS